jgi:hypothetical protein
LPSCQPKDSPAYQRWYQANEEARRLRDAPEYDPRTCPCGRSFTPRAANHLRCATCKTLRPRRPGSRRRTVAADLARLDWLEAHGVVSIYLANGQQINPASVGIRTAIDLARGTA